MGKKNVIRRVVTTTPVLLRNIIKTRSLRPHLKQFTQHNGGGCCNKGRCTKPDMEKIRQFQQHLHTKMNHEKVGINPHFGQHSPQQNRTKSNDSAILMELPVEEEELD